MKCLYLDCGMGASGDMFAAALLELLPDPDAFVDRLNRLGIPGVRYEKRVSTKTGVVGTRLRVTVNGVSEGDGGGDGGASAPSHTDLADIAKIISSLPLPDAVKRNALAVYRTVADAEGRAHGVPAEKVHFHEVGAADAVADVVAGCLLTDTLAPDETVVSPVRVGYGTVRCAHGILPVPAPATAEILKGIPIYTGDVEGELCTPTGAALLKRFATRFGESPVMTVEKIGYGMGSKDFPVANCLRAMIGETEDETDGARVLSCNVDDMTAEAIGYACEKLYEAGALDVCTVPIGMKKGRPGVMIQAICRPEDEEKAIATFFARTCALGVRETRVKRFVLNRRIEREETAYGPVRRKYADGRGVSRCKTEYDDLARIADETGVGLDDARKMTER